MKLKRILIIFLITLLAVAFSGCHIDTAEEPSPPTAEPYPHDFICGYLLTFDDPNDENYVPPTSDDFTSDNAISRYVGLGYYGNSSYLYVKGGLFINNSHNKISIFNDPLATDKSGSIVMEEEFFYTSELKLKQAELFYVLYNAEKRNLYTADYCSVTFLDGLVGFSVSNDMQAKILNDERELETITYRFGLSIEFREIDALENIVITEYDNNDNLIKTVKKNSEELKALNNYLYEYEASDNCQYIIIGKQYNSKDGASYTDRTLYNKDKRSQSEIIYVPYGNGLTMPMEIKLTFTD